MIEIEPQLSYTVKDIDAAVQQFYELFGAGPFLKMGPLKYESCTVRGQEADPEIVIALGMWGPMQVEFVQKTNDEAMLFDENGYGFNHVNIIVDNYDEALAFLKEHGYEPGQEMTSSGKPIAYVDTMRLAKKHLPGLENYKQATIASHLGIDTKNAHRADADAEACGMILSHILASLSEKKKS